MRAVVGRVVSTVLMLWLGASAVGQLGSQRVQRLRRVDVLGVVPVWTFFAPNPATGDIYLVYRDDSARRWTEIHIRRPRRSWRACVWNPDRRAAKALFDIAGEIIQSARGSQHTGAVQLSVPYLTLLGFVCGHAAREQAAGAVQFMLLSDHGMEKSGDPVPVFISHWHTL